MKIAFFGQMPLKKEIKGVVALHRSGPFLDFHPKPACPGREPQMNVEH
jgi:hypothetical protein